MKENQGSTLCKTIFLFVIFLFGIFFFFFRSWSENVFLVEYSLPVPYTDPFLHPYSCRNSNSETRVVINMSEPVHKRKWLRSRVISI